jgi:hypothetical protein
MALMNDLEEWVWRCPWCHEIAVADTEDDIRNAIYGHLADVLGCHVEAMVAAGLLEVRRVPNGQDQYRAVPGGDWSGDGPDREVAAAMTGVVRRPRKTYDRVV